jgi:cellulose synthase/poly-beta-1,6-N-acetylglucosamine synthase-like glycosyltransferase/multidrug efflux pump subunit AcrA (membrane-fusion protein)
MKVLTYKKSLFFSLTISLLVAWAVFYPLELKLRSKGQIVPLRTVDVSALEGGIIEKLWIKSGQEVRQGQLLAEISNDELEERIFAASQLVERFPDRLLMVIKKYESQLEAHRTILKDAQYRERIARKEFEKQQYYREIRLASQSALKLAEEALKAKQALLQKKQSAYEFSEIFLRALRQLHQIGWAELDQATHEILLTDETVFSMVRDYIVANSDLSRYQISEDHLRIKAPFDGIIVTDDLFQKQGAPVRSGQTLMRILDLNSLVVQSNLTQNQYARLSGKNDLYTRVKIKSKNGQTRELTGIIETVNNKVENADPFDQYETENGKRIALREYETNPEDKEIPVLIRFPEGESLQSLLPEPKYGMKASVAIIHDRGTPVSLAISRIRDYVRMTAQATQNKWTLVIPMICIIFFCLYILYTFLVPIILIIGSFREHRHFYKRRFIHDVEQKPVSVLLPFYNEEANICETLKSLLKLDYSSFEIVMINDGSKDQSIELLLKKWSFREVSVKKDNSQRLDTKMVKRTLLCDTIPGRRILLIDKYNGGKADALNAGLNIAQHELCCFVDADTILEKDALKELVLPLIVDSKIAAAGGNIRIVNNCHIENGQVIEKKLPRELFPMFQVGEYLRGFAARLGWSNLNAPVFLSGAFCAYRKKYLLAIGGYNTQSIVEDFELTIQLHKYLREQNISYTMKTIPQACAWTQAPFTFKGLFRQRVRWFEGFLHTLYKFRSMIFNPTYGVVGLFAMPNLLLFSFIPIINMTFYIVLITAYFTLPAIIISFLWNLFLITISSSVIIGLTWLALVFFYQKPYSRLQHYLKIILFIFLESFGYIQFLQLPLCWSFFNYFFLRQRKWAVSERKKIAAT